MTFTMNDLTFRTSSHSGDEGNCVAIAEPGDGNFVVLDSKDRTGPRLRFTGAAWATFTAGIRGGEFDG